MKKLLRWLVVVALVAFVGMDAMAEVKDGTTFWLGTVPEELVAERRMGESVRFSLEENASTGFKWDVASNTNECTVVLKHRGGDKGATCGAPGLLDVTVTSRIRTPVRVEFRYRRPGRRTRNRGRPCGLSSTPSAGNNRSGPRC